MDGLMLAVSRAGGWSLKSPGESCLANIYVSQTAEAAGSHHLMVCSGRSAPCDRMTQVRRLGQDVLTSAFVHGVKPRRTVGYRSGVPWVLVTEMVKDRFVSERLQALEDETLRLREEAQKVSGFETYRGLARQAMVHFCKLHLKLKYLPELAVLGLCEVQFI
jgi:hypothetical protein